MLSFDQWVDELIKAQKEDSMVMVREVQEGKRRLSTDPSRKFKGMPEGLFMGQSSKAEPRLVIGQTRQQPLQVQKHSLTQAREKSPGVFVGGSRPPGGGGWMPIPGSKHGGFHRRKGAGWEYWYPNDGAHASHGKPEQEKFERKVETKVSTPRERKPIEQTEPKQTVAVSEEVKHEPAEKPARKPRTRKTTPTPKRGAGDVVSDRGEQGGVGTTHEAGETALGERAEKTTGEKPAVAADDKPVSVGDLMTPEVAEHAAKMEMIQQPSFNNEPMPLTGNTPQKSPAIPHYPEYLPEITVKLPENIRVFPNPDGNKKELFSHQVEGAERILTAWKDGDGCLLMDEAGLGKTLTAIAAMQAYGGKRRLIVVPTQGKETMTRQWQEDAAKVYGLELKGIDQLTPDAEGTFVIAYNDLLREERDAQGNVVKYKKGKEKKERVVMQLRPEIFDGKFDVIAFDESHNMKSYDRERTQAAILLQQSATKALYMSATPYDTFKEMYYLQKLGLWDHHLPEEYESLSVEKKTIERKKAFVKWAMDAGATVPPGFMGEPSIGTIRNPMSEMPSAAVSATMHASGKAVLRTTSMEGVHSTFHKIELDSLTDEQKKTFAQGEAIMEKASSFGVPDHFIAGMRAGWYKQTWEIIKVNKAIELGKKALAEGKQVAFYTHYKSADNAHLKSLATSLEKLSIRLADMDRMAESIMYRDYADKLNEMIDELPKGQSAVKQLTQAFGGPSKVSEIHGDTRKKPSDEQKRYNDGETKVVVATMDRGGTGISLHDTRGDAPRVQINLTLPYSGQTFSQVAGRSHRLGSKSDTEMHWLMGNDAHENKIAAIITHKLISRGSMTSGNPAMVADVADLANWEHSNKRASENAVDETDAMEVGDLEGPHGGQTSDDAKEDLRTRQQKIDEMKIHASEGVNEVKDFFANLMAAHKQGQDVVKEVGDRLRKERSKRAFAESKIAAEKIRIGGGGSGLKVLWRPLLGTYEILNPKKDDFFAMKRVPDLAEPIQTGTSYIHGYRVKPEHMDYFAKKLKYDHIKMTPDDVKGLKERFSEATDFDHYHKQAMDHGFLLTHNYDNEKSEPVYRLKGHLSRYFHALSPHGISQGYDFQIVGNENLKQALNNCDTVKKNNDYYRAGSMHNTDFGQAKDPEKPSDEMSRQEARDADKAAQRAAEPPKEEDPATMPGGKSLSHIEIKIKDNGDGTYSAKGDGTFEWRKKLSQYGARYQKYGFKTWDFSNKEDMQKFVDRFGKSFSHEGPRLILRVGLVG